MVFNLVDYSVTCDILYNNVFKFKYKNKVFEFQFSSDIKGFTRGVNRFADRPI